MLKALLNNQPILAWKIQKPIDYALTYFCEDCKEKVIWVDPVTKTTHFRHFPNSTCISRFHQGESESENHLLMKKKCFELFTQMGYDVEIEVWNLTKTIKSDLVIKKNGALIGAIEVQASSISSKKFIERNNKYTQGKIPVLWLFDHDIMELKLKKTVQSLYYGRFYCLRYKEEGDALVYAHRLGVLPSKIGKTDLFSCNVDSFKYGSFLILRFYDKKWW